MPGNLLNISLVRFTVDVLARAGLFDPVSNNQVMKIPASVRELK